MAKVLYNGQTKQITFTRNDGRSVSFECHNDTYSCNGQHEPLPNGTYILEAEEPPGENSPAFGTFYISTGDPRGRDIHGGGSSLPNPFAERQGWLGTYGCLRMQNVDGTALSYLLLDEGSPVEMEVINVDPTTAIIDEEGEQ